jgi:hypothetical protein
MSKWRTIVEDRTRTGTTVGVAMWMALCSLACSQTVPPGTSAQMVAGDPRSGEAGAADDGGTDDAYDSGQPTYVGAPGATEQPTPSGSIASADGGCPIPDSLAGNGSQCLSCAQSHCSSDLSACDPTMVSACTHYYCPTQCASPGAASADACSTLTSCCPTLFATLLSGRCLAAQTGGVASTCASFIATAQSEGYCM